MKLRIPDGWHVTTEAMRKALQREPQPEPVRIEFDESRLLDILDRAEALAGAYAAIDKQRIDAIDMVREIKRQIGYFESQAGALTGEAAKYDQKQLERLYDRLEDAQRRLDQLDGRWEESGKRLRAARALADRLKQYATEELGWVPPGEDKTYQTT